MKQPKIFLLVVDGPRRKLSLAFAEADHTTAEGACPACGAEAFGVQGGGKRPSADDRAWEADAVSTCCKQHVGTIRHEVNTLFGVREDRAVLEGRCRVY